MKSFHIGFLLTVNFLAQGALAAEPAFCDPAQFDRLEVSYPGNDLPDRLRVFRIGAVTVAGMAIGKSDVAAVAGVADRYSAVAPARGHCTWYFGDNNEAAQSAFNHRPLPVPHWLLGSEKSFADAFESKLQASFATDSMSFATCAREQKFIGLGCDSQKHRGPSVFAMVLTYAGCSAEHATQIANSLWDENGVRARVAIAQRGASIAAKNPAAAAEFRALLEAGQ